MLAQNTLAEIPKPVRRGLVASYGQELDALVHSMLGLRALMGAMQDVGVDINAVLAGTGVTTQQLSDAEARMSQRQKIALFRNVHRLSCDPTVGLKAGQMQRLADYGVYGYALVSSATFGEAVAFGIEHIRLAGPVLEKSFRVEGDVAIFEGHDVMDLGELLPLATEFWFSSTQALISFILGRHFQAIKLKLPYPAPAYASSYEASVGCPVEFDAGVMQWEFDAALLALPLPNANRITAVVCGDFCDRMLEAGGGENTLVTTIKTFCLNDSKGGQGFPRVEAMSDRLNLSPRTLHRRLADAGTCYQDILDGIRKRLSVELLADTNLSIEQIADRNGFADVSNFRKAFKKWTGHSPAHFRSNHSGS